MSEEKKEKKRENPVAVWDGTMPMRVDVPKEEQKLALMRVLARHAKKWAFQLEKGEVEGKLHWQIRLDARSKVRMSSLINWFEEEKEKLTKAHWSPSSGNSRGKTMFSYVMKEHTRVDLPVTDVMWTKEEARRKDMEALEKSHPKLEEKFRPWQAAFIQEVRSMTDETHRMIWVICDPLGSAGKNTIIRYLRAHGLATCIMPTEAKAMTQHVASIALQGLDWHDNALVINFVRDSMKDSKAMWAGIEMIRDGELWETRYKAQRASIGNVPIIVFCNEMPELKALTGDRWRLNLINHKHELVGYGEAKYKALRDVYRKSQEIDQLKRLENEQDMADAKQIYKDYADTMNLWRELTVKHGRVPDQQRERSSKKRKSESEPDEDSISTDEAAGDAAEEAEELGMEPGPTEEELQEAREMLLEEERLSSPPSATSQSSGPA